jgi:hypothetical protein
MSSEYIYERKAINLRGEKETYTALFTKSHSSNDGDHTPRWKLYHFSKQADALPYVAQCAHYCDSGLTRGPGGMPLSGEQEITSWRVAVNTASVLNDASPVKAVDLVFSPTPRMDADSVATMMAILSLAGGKGVGLHHHIADDKAAPPSNSFITLDLSYAAHVDLIWEAINTIKVPSLYGTGTMVALGAYRFFDSVKGLLARGVDFPADANPLVTQPVKGSTTLLKLHLGKTFHKFEFPVKGQPVYKDCRIVVANWACRVLSLDPDRWFGNKLAMMEKVQPGCAESAYRAWKRHIKALPVTPVSRIGTVEVCPLNGASAAAENETRATMQSLESWQQETVKAFFAAHGKNPEVEAVYTNTVEDHLAALCLSGFVPCCIAVDEMAPA